MALYIPHIVLKFQVNISNTFLSSSTLCVPTLGWAADLPFITMEEVAISQARPA